MSTSYRFDSSNTSNTASVQLPSAVAGVVDVVGQGPAKRVNEQLTSAHPLESRLANWEDSQLKMKLHMQRSLYGLHAPMRTMMEIQSVGSSLPSRLPGSRAARMQLDILMGKDDTIDVEDILDSSEYAEMPDVHRTFVGRTGF
ncbi:hypothetical protein FB645_005783 [Coemansia sp. IMI 203386]|nr:hypothetical protein FB645_005783 [Coemansia sp. IMI 203386]